MALTISRLPLQILFNMIFSVCVYFLAGLPLEPWRFLMFALVGVIVSAVAEGLGLAIGATFSVTVSNFKAWKLWKLIIKICRMAAQLVPLWWLPSSVSQFMDLTLPQTCQLSCMPSWNSRSSAVVLSLSFSQFLASIERNLSAVMSTVISTIPKCSWGIWESRMSRCLLKLVFLSDFCSSFEVSFI